MRAHKWKLLFTGSLIWCGFHIGELNSKYNFFLLMFKINIMVKNSIHYSIPNMAYTAQLRFIYKDVEKGWMRRLKGEQIKVLEKNTVHRCSYHQGKASQTQLQIFSSSKTSLSGHCLYSPAAASFPCHPRPFPAVLHFSSWASSIYMLQLPDYSNGCYGPNSL